MRNSNSTRGARRETRNAHNNNNNNNNNNRARNSNDSRDDDNNNVDQPGNQYRPRKQHSQYYQQPQQQTQQQPQQSQQKQQDSHHQQQLYHHHSQDRREPSGQRDQNNYRDRSGQRTGQYPDSSMGRDGIGSQSNLGSVKFTPGLSTRDLPPIDTKADPNKKFTGRCRLFVGNLAHNTSEEQVRSLFEPFGEIGELYLGPKSSFAFVKIDTKQNAERARDALDCSIFEGRSLRVRLAAHAAAIRVKHLSPVVTNELLAYAFRYFGEIERAVVVVDDKGKSTGEGIVEYSRKQSALYAIKRCQQECFMLTASPMPVHVEPYDQHDEDEGLPEKSVNKNSIEYKEQRDVGPRFAEQGTFEHSFALKWKDLYNVEKQKRERLEQEIEEARKNLQDQIEYSRLEHDTMQLRSKLQQLEDNRIKLQQMKEQSSNVVQQREEQRRQQDMLIRQQEEEILRRQQLGEHHYIVQQETNLRSQAHVLQEMMGGPESEHADLNQQSTQQNQEQETNIGNSNQMLNQGPRTFADAAMMGMNQYMQPQPIPTQLSMQQQPSQQAMFTGYIPPPPIQVAVGDSSGSSNYGNYQQAYVVPQTSQPSDTNNRQQKMTRSFTNQGNNINVVGRPRKRGRY